MQYTEYRCKQGDVLDAVCFAHYGTENMVEAIMNHNNGLAGIGTHLPLGLLIRLPVVTQTSVRITQTVSLWD